MDDENVNFESDNDGDNDNNNDNEPKIKIDPFALLLSYQIPHVQKLYEAFTNLNCVLDASDTGTGKTFTTIALCFLLGLDPFIISPKSVIQNWIDVAQKMGVKLAGLANYEKLKGGKYYTENLENVVCPYIDKIGEGKKVDYIFQLPPNIILIFDEAHRCKNHKTSTSKMLMAAKDTGNKVLLLSATITDKIDCFRPFGAVFGLYEDVKKYKIWLRRQLKMKNVEIKTIKDKKKKTQQIGMDDNTTSNDAIVLKIIHDAIFPERGSRMKIKELGDLFPKCQVVAKCYYSDDHNEVDKLYNEINAALEDLKNKEKRSEALGKIIRSRMKIEMLKVPIMIDMIEDAVEQGMSVAVFVNYKDTMNYLAHHLKVDCFIHGEQSLEDRQSCINDFQSNKCKIIICIIQAGGVGISLHDLHGGHPRMSVISPSWSGTDTVQALGRIHRSGAKSPALQRLVYIAKSYEEMICRTVSSKLATLSAINDGDMVGPKIDTQKLKVVDDNNDVPIVNAIDNMEAEEVLQDDLDNKEKIPTKTKKIKTIGNKELADEYKDKKLKKKKYVVVNDGEATDMDKGKLKQKYFPEGDTKRANLAPKYWSK
jgi:superfamily II DNA or RNA helicase